MGDDSIILFPWNSPPWLSGRKQDFGRCSPWFDFRSWHYIGLRRILVYYQYQVSKRHIMYYAPTIKYRDYFIDLTFCTYKV